MVKPDTGLKLSTVKTEANLGHMTCDKIIVLKSTQVRTKKKSLQNPFKEFYKVARLMTHKSTGLN